MTYSVYIMYTIKFSTYYLRMYTNFIVYVYYKVYLINTHIYTYIHHRYVLSGAAEHKVESYADIGKNAVYIYI